MKTTVSKLRTLIREYLEVPREELVKMINDMPPDEVATEDYVDDCGEVLLSKGERGVDSYVHEKHPKSTPTKWYDEDDFDDYEDDDDYNVVSSDLLMNAVKEFASHVSNDLPDDTDAQNVAPDMVESFFYEYPQWEEWARKANMKKYIVKEIVTDAVYDALTK